MSQLSKNQVKKAGRVLRNHATGERLVSQTAVQKAIEMLEAWRAAHATPLLKARMGLQSRLATVRHQASVSQRLKRRPTIVDKLVRQPNNQLTTMHDIAGCRAVLPDAAAVNDIWAQWRRTGSGRIQRTYDYLSIPKPDGYRGVHLVVQYDNHLVEIQLRTQYQHAWSVAVERAGDIIGADLKSGRGPDEVLELFKMLGNILARADGLESSPPTREEFLRTATTTPAELLKAIGLSVDADRLSFSPLAD